MSGLQSESLIPVAQDSSDASTSGVAAKQEICRQVVENCRSVYGNRLRAMVLTGSLARNEATFIRVGKGLKLLGDADCFLIFQRDASLPPASDTHSLQRKIEGSLTGKGLSGKIGLSAVTPRFLKNLPRAISTIELRDSGQVLWGDPSILSMIPKFSESDIIREDAWRMLCNRMIEQLAFAGDLSGASTELTPELHYATVKLFLDMATSFSVFVEQYAPSYRERSERLLALAQHPPEGTPFPLKKFAARVAECTSWKLSGENRDCDRRVELWHEAISYMRRLWRWEMIQLTNASKELTIESLLSQLARQQTASQRLRGWLSIAKRRGSLRSWRCWPRWIRLSLASTPRYLVYRAATELTFRLPCLVRHAGQPPRLDVDWGSIQSRLPERAPHSDSSDDIPWRGLVDDVLWNYSEFLLNTRA